MQCSFHHLVTSNCNLSFPSFLKSTLFSDNGDDSRGQAEIIIAKHRNGSLNNVRLKFTAEFAKFTDLDYFEENTFENSEHSSMISLSSKMNNDEEDPF